MTWQWHADMLNICTCLIYLTTLYFRMIKRYELNYHSAMGEVIPGHTTSMSSYAGSVASLDDFYLISSGLAATETSLFVYDRYLGLNLPRFFLWHILIFCFSAVLANLSATGIVYEPFRVLLANRMAKNSAEWQDIFKRYNRCSMIVPFKFMSNVI